MLFLQKFVSEGSVVRDCIDQCTEKGKWNEKLNWKQTENKIGKVFIYFSCFFHINVWIKKRYCSKEPFRRMFPNYIRLGTASFF